MILVSQLYAMIDHDSLCAVVC